MYPLSWFFKSLLLSVLVVLPSLALGQELDLEPNNPCPVAQDVVTPFLPVAIAGGLDAIGGAPDIDFFRFSGVPGEFIRADHQGATTGVGTLGDPLLGLFDADCNLIGVNDDSGTLDSRLTFAVPDDGIYVLAATAFPDFEFVGAGEGSYLLTVSSLQAADSISGRLVSALDGTPIPGDSPAAAFVQLFRCGSEEACYEFIQFQQADSAGNFLFDSDFTGNPLLSGIYQVQAGANGFEFLATDAFEVSEGQALDLGDIALTPLQLIGSVSGRILDAIDGTPLIGFGPPFATAVLERCEDFGCFGVVGQPTDEFGRFHIPGALYLLAPGTYRVTASAEDYQPQTTVQFTVEDSENADIGDILLTQNPIQFGAVHECEIPPGGGPCVYGVEVRNRGPGRFIGAAWSTVEFFPNEFPFRSSRFQVGRAGATNPMPQALNLRAGQTALLQFRLEVPLGVPDNSTICATATVGTRPAPQFQNIGDRFLFCAVKQSGHFELLPEKEGRKRARELTTKPVQ